MDDAKRIETRISLVLYGGVSLAVYMSGACQELLSVVRASSSTISDEALSPVERKYREICRSGGTDNQPRRVVVDVLAGSSAGGLNALFLAKALAHGGSLDSLRQIWYEQADLLKLMALDEPDGAEANGKRASGKPSDAEQAETDDFRKALLDGQWFHGIIHDALKDLSNQGSDDEARLVDDVDCFVTTTDLRGVAETVRLDNSGEVKIQELRRRGVFHFTDRRSKKFETNTKTQLDADHDSVLAFAGRATASHPGSFYPAQWNQIDSRRGDAENRAPGLEEFLSPRLHPEGGPLDLQDRWYSDGGVMDNKPFKYALEPLRNRRADVPVDRKVVFIEPDPVAELDDWHQTTPPALWNYTAGTYGLARAENIREDIAELAARNESIASLDSALVGLFGRDRDEVRSALEARLPAGYSIPDHENQDDHDRKLAAAVLGEGYDRTTAEGTEGVVELWVNQRRSEFGQERGWGAVVLEDYRWRAMVSHLVQSALTVGESPADQALVAKLVEPVEVQLREWMTNDGSSGEIAPNPVRKGLKLLDVDYRLRRFTLIEHLLSNEQRRILSNGGSQERFDQCVALRQSINGLYADLNHYLEDRRSELIIDHRNMSDEELLCFIKSDEMRKQIEKTVDDLDDPLRRASRDGRAAIRDAGLDTDLLLLAADAWVNYGDYDQLILPMADTAASKFGTIDAIRISPLDAPGLVSEVVGDSRRRKLGGNALHHFGGFIDANWRLNDITWGRFDTAEVLVTQVLNGSRADVTAIHHAMLSELAAEVRPDRGKVAKPDSPLDALLAVNANDSDDNKPQTNAKEALKELRAVPVGDTAAIDAAADKLVSSFELLLREPSGWSVDLSANDHRNDNKKEALNKGAALLGKAVALSGNQGRPSRIVAGWLLSASLRLALPLKAGEKAARHGLPPLLTGLGLALLLIAFNRDPVAAGLTVGSLAAGAYSLYARARAFGVRYNVALWQGIGVGAFAGAVVGLVAAFWLAEAAAGLAMLAVSLAAIGGVMWFSLDRLEDWIQKVGHPKSAG